MEIKNKAVGLRVGSFFVFGDWQDKIHYKTMLLLKIKLYKPEKVCYNYYALLYKGEVCRKI